jgi:hypothetical protein
MIGEFSHWRIVMVYYFHKNNAVLINCSGLLAAVVDLNGRFFGGRQVKAGFYSWEKLNNLELLD